MASGARPASTPRASRSSRRSLQSLMLQRPLEETLGLISRRVCELGDVRLLRHRAARRPVGAHPPRRVARRSRRTTSSASTSSGSRRSATPSSPARRPSSALRRRETAVLTDALSDESFRPWRALATEFGYRSLVSAPLVVQGEVLGALNGYSARPRTLTTAQLQTVETLAGQAALALRHDDARRRPARDDRPAARGQRAAARAPADARALARHPPAAHVGRHRRRRLPRGRPDARRPHRPRRPRHRRRRPADLHVGGPAARPGAARRRRPTRSSGASASARSCSATSSSRRATRHRATSTSARSSTPRTVLALEIVKERVARTTEERLRSDFLSDLLDGPRHGRASGSASARATTG